MKKFVTGELKDKLMFIQLLEINSPTVIGLDEECELVSIFLSAWNSHDVQDLLDYLNMLKDKNDSHEDYEDIIQNGIHDDINSTLFFEETHVVIVSNSKESKKILIDTFITIVANWKLYLAITKNEKAVYYGGRFFFDKQATHDK